MAFQFDEQRFAEEIRHVPQVRFIGSGLQIRYKHASDTPGKPAIEYAFSGFLASVAKDVLVMLHCSASTSPSTAAAGSATSSNVVVPPEIMSSSSPDAAASPSSSFSPSSSLNLAAATAATAASASASSSSSFSPPRRSFDSLPNITLLRRNIDSIDVEDESVSLPRRACSSGSKIDAEMIGRKLIVQRALKAIPDSLSDGEFLASHGVQYVALLVDEPPPGTIDHHQSPLPGIGGGVGGSGGGGGGGVSTEDDANHPYSDVDRMLLTSRELTALKMELARTVHDLKTVGASGLLGLALTGGAGAAGGNGGGGAAGGGPANRLGRIFAAIDDTEVRAALRDERAYLQSWGSKAVGFTIMSGLALIVFSGYLWVATSGSLEVLHDASAGIRISGVVVGGLAIAYSLFLSWEREQLAEMNFSASMRAGVHAARHAVLLLIIAPAVLILYSVAAGIEGWQYDIMRRMTLEQAYLDYVQTGSTTRVCSFFRVRSCSGFRVPCANDTSSCPTGKNSCTEISTALACEPSMVDLLQQMSRPTLVIASVVTLGLAATLFFSHRMSVLAQGIDELQAHAQQIQIQAQLQQQQQQQQQ